MKNNRAWRSCLELSSDRSITAGSSADLCSAIGRGADLRIYTEFKFNEHIDITSDNDELVQEVSEFPVTYLIDERWSAGIMTWRQPVSLPDGFGAPSMSFFLYNQDGQQAIARPFLDGRQPEQQSQEDLSKIKKYHQLDDWDRNTNAPSHNFIYDFERFKYCVRDDWRELYAHDEAGNRISGSLDALIGEFENGSEIKVGIRGACDYLTQNPGKRIPHELFVRTGAGYYHTDAKVFGAATYPLVRGAAAAPLSYSSKNWDFGWCLVDTGGAAVQRICDPFTLQFKDRKQALALRWFAR